MNETFSITFGECAENHVGMQKIGNYTNNTNNIKEFNLNDFKLCQEKFPENCELIDLSLKDNDPNSNTNAKTKGSYLFILRDGVRLLGDDPDIIFKKLKKLPYDTKAKMRGKVVNKIARYNSCFSDFTQKADFKNGKGTVINFKDTPLVKLRKNLEIFGKKAKNLQGELNYYYDVNKCGIGYHGDSERKIVVCARFGASIPICFQWFGKKLREDKIKAIGPNMKYILNHGDIYCMTNCGWNWKRSMLNLRHAAGCEKYLQINKKYL